MKQIKMMHILYIFSPNLLVYTELNYVFRILFDTFIYNHIHFNDYGDNDEFLSLEWKKDTAKICNPFHNYMKHSLFNRAKVIFAYNISTIHVSKIQTKACNMYMVIDTVTDLHI